jgi:hypothetical protein
MASVRTYITETEFAKIDSPQSSTTYIVLDDNDPTIVKKVVFKTNNINKEGEVYIVQDEYPTPSGAISITANAENIDVKQYATANVNVPNPSTGTLNITANDDYDVTEYAGVSVNVPNPSTGTLNITVNDDYDVTEYAGVSVNVPNPSTGTLNITVNDDYDVTDYAGVSVNVPNPSTGTLVITSNDTFDVTNYANVDVNVPTGEQKTCSFKFNSDGQFQFNKSGYGKYYLKTNSGNWIEYDDTATIDVHTNDVIELKSNVKQLSTSSVFTFNDKPGSAATVSWELEGDLLGALYGDTLPPYACYHMFKKCTGLTKVPNDMFTSYEYVSANCCEEMFRECTSLTTAPALPATKIASYCYRAMLMGCTALTTVPTILPATTTYDSCYRNLFQGCTSLATAPELPATTVEYYSYGQMFYGCTSLNYIKCLATTFGGNALDNWVYHVSATGTFVKDANATFPTWTNSGIPDGWTVQDA